MTSSQSGPGVVAEPTALKPERDPRLFNAELAPESATGTWKTKNIFAWWMSSWHSLGGYTMAIGLFTLGLSGWQMMLSLSVGAVILFFAANLSGIAGQRVKVPFPVFARASFGVFGANIPAVLRAIVAIAWYGIQTYLASTAGMLLLLKMVPAAKGLSESNFLGLSGLGWICFLVLSALQLLVLLRGMEAVRRLSDFAGPAIWVAMIALAVWVLNRAGWQVDFAYSTLPQNPLGAQTLAMLAGVFLTVAYFAGPILNFADFTRNSPAESDVRKGNAWGLLVNGVAFCVITVIIALASVKVYGKAIHDPIALLADIDSVFILLVAIIAIGIATAGINIILNFVAPVYDMINVWPKTFTFHRAGIVIAVMAIVITPWNLFSNPVLINQFIGGVGALMGPLFGVIMTDYYIVKKQNIDPESLFDLSPQGRYVYNKGYNTKAVTALGISGIITIAVSLIPGLSSIAPFSWPIGVLSSVAIYLALNKAPLAQKDLR